jgi:HD superfamily phosphodiesterase
MNLTVTIESAERQFKQILEEYFITVYDEKYLTSHGIDHHRRVWNNAKELLYIYGIKHEKSICDLPPKLILACYLHDIGMSVESGPRHGKKSRELCLGFLAKNNLTVSDYQDVLETIENHDNKVYTKGNGSIDLLKILSVADDLDAFGFIGIFRYSEIYMTRGLNLMKIGHEIRKNAAGRFENFLDSYPFPDDFIKIHRKRYTILDDFFREYNKQLDSYLFEEKFPFGYCGVMEVLLQLVNNKITLKDLRDDRDINAGDQIIDWFINNLLTELTRPY